MVTAKEVIGHMARAQHEVQVLGVVALDDTWQELAGAWTESIARNANLKIKILCESDNMLFGKAFTYDTETASPRRSFQELKFIRDQALQLPALLDNRGVVLEDDEVSVEIMHLEIPVSIVQVDDAIFANLWLHELSSDYEEIDKKHPWRSSLERYIQAYCDPSRGRKYAGEADSELLELFDHNRIPRGIFPRSSFYDTDYSQLVVWALVFDREGRLLIHRRADNAKDNQGMWDKSVGGHVDFSIDVDTSRAVLREVIEELFSDEMKERSKFFTAWSVADDDVLYLGEWRSSRRRQHPFDEIKSLHKEWAFFRLHDSQHLYSPRTLPNGQERRLWVIADVFLFVAGPGFTDSTLGDLKNSEFKLISLQDLKTVMDKALRKEVIAEFDPTNPIPKFSPDLINIMTGQLRDVLEEFSQYLKRYAKN